MTWHDVAVGLLFPAMVWLGKMVWQLRVNHLEHLEREVAEIKTLVLEHLRDHTKRDV